MSCTRSPRTQGLHDAQGLGYPLLRDVDGKHVDAFGVPDENLGGGIPLPGVLWLAPDGRILIVGGIVMALFARFAWYRRQGE